MPGHARIWYIQQDDAVFYQITLVSCLYCFLFFLSKYWCIECSVNLLCCADVASVDTEYIQVYSLSLLVVLTDTFSLAYLHLLLFICTEDH